MLSRLFPTLHVRRDRDGELSEVSRSKLVHCVKNVREECSRMERGGTTLSAHSLAALLLHIPHHVNRISLEFSQNISLMHNRLISSNENTLEHRLSLSRCCMWKHRLRFSLGSIHCLPCSTRCFGVSFSPPYTGSYLFCLHHYGQQSQCRQRRR